MHLVVARILKLNSSYYDTYLKKIKMWMYLDYQYIQCNFIALGSGSDIEIVF